MGDFSDPAELATVATYQLVIGAVHGYTEYQAQSILASPQLLQRLARLWDSIPPGATILALADREDQEGVLHRKLLEATGHQPPSTADLSAELEDLMGEIELFLMFAEAELTSRGPAPAEPAIYRRADHVHDVDVEVYAGGSGRWSIVLRSRNMPLNKWVLALRWADGSITTHVVPALAGRLATISTDVTVDHVPVSMRLLPPRSRTI
jgi:hypothetical protein